MTVVCNAVDEALASGDLQRLREGLPPVARGILKGLVALHVADKAAEFGVWSVMVDGRPFGEAAAAWVAGRMAALSAKPAEARLSLAQVRLEVEGSVEALGPPGSDMLADAEGRVLRFRWGSGAWLAYRAAPHGPKGGLPPERALWTPFPDSESWPTSKVDTFAERVGAGLEALTPAMRVELEKRLCWLHGGPVSRCQCPTMLDVLAMVWKRAAEKNTLLRGEATPEVDPRAKGPGLTAQAAPQERPAERESGADEDEDEDEETARPDPTPASSTTSTPSSSSPVSTPTPAPSSSTQTAPSIFDGQGVLSRIPPRFFSVGLAGPDGKACGCSHIADDPPTEPCHHGSRWWTHLCGDHDAVGTAYAGIVLAKALRGVTRDQLHDPRCRVCGQPFVEGGEGPLASRRGGKLLIGVHMGCALDHAPPSFVVAGNGRECRLCRQGIAGEAVLVQLEDDPTATGVHRDSRVCLGAVPKAVAVELDAIEKKWTPAPESAGRKLKRPCATCLGPIEKGAVYETLDQERRHAPCPPK